MDRTKRQNSEPVVQNNNILYVMMGVITLFLVFITVKMFALEKKINSGTAGTVAQQESPISVDNMKKYAKELGLNTGKFNKCLDSGEKKTLVDKDAAYGTALGVQGTPGFFINGQFLAGAFPFQFFKEIIDRQLAGTSSSECTSYSEELQKYCSDPQNIAFNPAPKQVDVDNMIPTGAKNGKITIVEFSDFECPFCIRALPTVKQVLSEYKNDVTLYLKQFPLTQIHPQALKAAEGAFCAADQGKFWEWHDKIFEVQAQGQAQ